MCEIDRCPAVITDRVERWPITDPAALPPERRREIRDDIARRVRILLDEVRTQVSTP